MLKSTFQALLVGEAKLGQLWKEGTCTPGADCGSSREAQGKRLPRKKEGQRRVRKTVFYLDFSFEDFTVGIQG